MEQHIINGFKKCGLYPFEPNNVDYTKCVKNYLNQSVKSVQNLVETSEYEIETTKKVIEKVREKLSGHGIDVDVIIEEVSNLGKKENEVNILVGAVLPMDAFEIDYNTEIVLEGDEVDALNPPSYFEKQNEAPTDNDNLNQVLNLTDFDNENAAPTKDGTQRLNPILNMPDFNNKKKAPTKEDVNDHYNVSNKNYLENMDKETETEYQKERYMKRDEEMDDQTEIKKLINDILSAVCNSVDKLCDTVASNNNENTMSNNKIQYVPLNIAIDNVLRYKNPPDPSTKNVKNKDKMPRAISSQAWRNLQYKKEEEQVKKAESIKRKKEERAVAKEKKETSKKIKTTKKKCIS